MHHTLGPTSGSGFVRSVIIAILGVALTGCAPKELPDWAASGPVERVAFERGKAARAAERYRPDRGPPGHPPLPSPDMEILPFTPEWQAREDEFDKRLRRSMHICGNC